MPAAKKSTTTNGTAKKAAVSKRAKVEEAEDVEAPHELEVVVVAKKASAKAAAKASAAKNTKKRAREDDSDVEDSLEVETPKRSAKVTAKATKAAPLGAKATGKKASAAKKSATKDESDDESSFEEEKVAKKKTGARKAKSEEDEEAAAKKSSQKKASAKKSASDSDEDDGGEPVLVEIPTDFSSPSLSPGEMKIVSWNVAGYRAVLGKGFETYLKNEQPDIVCLQESKVISEREKMLFGYHAYFFGCKAKPGLHGTALFSKTKPIKVDFLTDFDEEGRVLLAEFPTFYIINTYVPNSGMKLERLAYRLDWDKKLQSMFLELQKKKPVIWCGDLNVAKDPIDLANPTGNVRKITQTLLKTPITKPITYHWIAKNRKFRKF